MSASPVVPDRPAGERALQVLLHRLLPDRFARVPAADPSATMPAVVYTRHGAPDVLTPVDRFPRPRPRPEHALVRVRAAGVNPLDFKLRIHPIPRWLLPLPKIPGTDLAGEVLDAPAGSGFAEGDRVYAMMPPLGSSWGASAGVASVPLTMLAPMPASLDYAQAAALPLVALTVMQGVDRVVAALASVTAGRRALVQAGSGGVGTFAVQYLHRVLGMTVAATCSERNAGLVRGLGADQVIDYQRERFEDRVRDLDLVVDPLAYCYADRTLRGRVLRPGGHYIDIAGSDWAQRQRDMLGLGIPETDPRYLLRWLRHAAPDRLRALALRRPPTRHLVFVHPDGARLRRLTRLVDDGRLIPILDRTFPLAEAAAAHRYLQSGRARGKVVLVLP
jgi:alcohol dehydrogenase